MTNFRTRQINSDNIVSFCGLLKKYELYLATLIHILPIQFVQILSDFTQTANSIRGCNGLGLHDHAT